MLWNIWSFSENFICARAFVLSAEAKSLIIFCWIEKKTVSVGRIADEMAPTLINFVATLFSPPNCSFDLSVTCSVTNVVRRGSLSLSNTNQAMYIQWILQCLRNYFCTPIVLRANVDFSLLLLDLQIIKASTTAQEGTMTSSLRGLRRRRPRPRSISPSCPPQAPQAPPSEVWTTPCRATTPPARCSASPISCPTTQGTLPARSPAFRGPCTASPPRCLALVRPLPHCRWTAADTTTTCPTRPRKWTRALCGSFWESGLYWQEIR